MTNSKKVQRKEDSARFHTKLYLAPVDVTDVLWPFLCSSIPEEVPAGKALPYLRSLAEFE